MHAHQHRAAHIHAHPTMDKYRGPPTPRLVMRNGLLHVVEEDDDAATVGGVMSVFSEESDLHKRHFYEDQIERAQRHMREGLHIEAAQLFVWALKQAAPLQPDDVEVVKHLATCLIKAGNTSDAHHYLTKAQELAPDDVDVLFALGELCSGMGRLQEAVQAYEGAVQTAGRVLFPNDPRIAQFRAALATAVARRRCSSSGASSQTSPQSVSLGDDGSVQPNGGEPREREVVIIGVPLPGEEGSGDDGADGAARGVVRSKSTSAHTPLRWVPDAMHKACMHCARRFTLLRRRHHCRCCGDLVCARCSPKKVELVHLGFKRRVRVCDLCRHSGAIQPDACEWGERVEEERDRAESMYW